MKRVCTVGSMGVIRRLVVLTATGALLLSVSACGRGRPQRAASPTVAPAADAAQQARSQADARISFLEQRAKDDPLDVFGLNELAVEHLQRARETGDVSAISRAANALRLSLERRPRDNYEATALSASVAVIQHDFGRALELANEAIALKPKNAYAYGVLGDADMGLGRYGEAAAAYQTMHAMEPSLSSFGRLALLAQTNGRLEEAAADWREALAFAHGDGLPEHEAWVRAQTANLDFSRGDLDAAESEYDEALAVFPNYVHALAGVGRVAAARGDLDNAAKHYLSAINIVPLPEYVIALGDVYEAAGNQSAANDQYGLVTAIEQLYNANGVNLDLQIALFKADHHRDLEATVRKARVLFEAQPSIAAADALAWTLLQAGDVDGARFAIADALHTGVREPTIMFHAGVIYKAAGDNAAAERYLQHVQDTNPEFSVRYARMARQSLEDIRSEATR